MKYNITNITYINDRSKIDFIKDLKLESINEKMYEYPKFRGFKQIIPDKIEVKLSKTLIGTNSDVSYKLEQFANNFNQYCIELLKDYFKFDTFIDMYDINGYSKKNVRLFGCILTNYNFDLSTFNPNEDDEDEIEIFVELECDYLEVETVNWKIEYGKPIAYEYILIDVKNDKFIPSGYLFSHLNSITNVEEHKDKIIVNIETGEIVAYSLNDFSMICNDNFDFISQKENITTVKEYTTIYG